IDNHALHSFPTRRSSDLGAKVELSGGAGVKRETTTNSAGEYTFSLVPPGTYTVSVSAQNFRKTELKNVVVRITETTRLNLPLVRSEEHTSELQSRGLLV